MAFVVYVVGDTGIAWAWWHGLCRLLLADVWIGNVRGAKTARRLMRPQKQGKPCFRRGT